MKVSSIILALTLVSLTGISCAEAESGNPFGFETGTHPLTYEYCKKITHESYRAHYGYECTFAPKMHPDIESILLHYVEDVGLCYIKAVSFSLGNSEKAKNAVDTFKDQIAKKYGPPTGQLEEKDPHDPSQLEEYRYEWSTKNGFRGLGNVVGIIAWKDRDRYRAKIQFELRTNELCQKQLDENRVSAF